MPLPCSAGWFMDWVRKVKTPAIPFPHIPLTPQQNADVAGGVATSNILQTAEITAKIVDKLTDKPELAGEVTHHATKGIFTGAGAALRDGVVEHPIIAGLALTAGVTGGLYYKFRELTDEEKEQAQIKKDKRLAKIREAASIVKADMFADEYRTCLNRHAYDHGASCDEKIQRCHSPARKLAMENKKRATKITKAYREYA